MSTTQVIQVLGGNAVVGEVRGPIEMVAAIRRGLPWAAIEAVGSALALSLSELSEVLHITPRTLSRRKRTGRLEVTESDRLFRLARVFAHAVEVFETRERARDWLESENRALGGQKPLELLDTEAGAQEVEEALGRIEHGIFA